MTRVAEVKFRFCHEQDIPEIITLLQESELPTEDVNPDKIQFILALIQGEIVGCIGLEAYGSHGLLRSMVVRKTFQNQGIGSSLYERFQGYCIQIGVQDFHLFTVDADKFFLSKGFVLANRENAPSSIQNTTEFTDLCPSTYCTYLVKSTPQREAQVFRNDLLNWQTEKDSNSQYWEISGEHMSFTYFEVPANSAFPEHKHENEQITLVLEGRLFFEVNGVVSCLETGDNIVIPSNLSHKVWTENDGATAVDSWAPALDLKSKS